ncbi:hypothetical protein BJ123_102260 [Rhodopseudomonas thermotolerans]|jgi:hypothetical protein|uniref:Uncharacterized protein n=2 Tax=Rhodopseudomonas TaxID=1073 RepID=A0A336JIE1_9BRAD|nr:MULTISPECIES: hypothetical protein [Rhodopseudomonas]RED42087.1 hypothetical protein BJ125_102258 [Rhodopseudomonas pentothenatexigens]REG07548.1 hypothetical protein BJ123_102260 [Rhodopseudomonas thermotolerans]SSW89447.1 hypothetical protein SAMN05892882_102258 [Rhodopseudomonas pentothenatexigens]
MVAQQAVAPEFETAHKLLDLLERDGFPVETAVWVPDDEGRGRLYIVPRSHPKDTLRETIRVAETIVNHSDELPGRNDLRYTIAKPDHPIVQAVRSVSSPDGRVRGAYRNGTYVDEAYVLRPAA